MPVFQSESQQSIRLTDLSLDPVIQTNAILSDVSMRTLRNLRLNTQVFSSLPVCPVKAFIRKNNKINQSLLLPLLQHPPKTPTTSFPISGRYVSASDHNTNTQKKGRQRDGVVHRERAHIVATNIRSFCNTNARCKKDSFARIMWCLETGEGAGGGGAGSTQW